MLNFKKQASLYKLERLFIKSKLLLCYQCNNVDTLEWSLLKKEFSLVNISNNLLKIAGDDRCSSEVKPLRGGKALALQPQGVITLLIKNKVAIKTQTISPPKEIGLINNSSIMETKEPLQVLKLFQGPTFVIGCSDKKLLVPIVNLLNNHTNFIFLGGVLDNKIINHLDLNLLRKLDKSVYVELVDALQYSIVNFLSVSQMPTTDLLQNLTLHTQSDSI